MRIAVATVALAGSAAAIPARISDYIRTATNTPATNDTATDNDALPLDEPCAIISREWQRSVNPDGVALVDAYLAHQCLLSVPLHAHDGYLQVEGVKTLAQFQSTLAYLKDPPEGYLYPAVDVLDGLDQILGHLNASSYTNEYDFQLDVLDVIQSAYDGHFTYQADITAVLNFGRPLPIFSVSRDGLSLPEVYYGPDVYFLMKNASSNATFSPIAQINGQNIEAYLNEYAAVEQQYQDPDASYNKLFAQGTKVAAFRGGFRSSTHYQGAETVILFKNGTTHREGNFAATAGNWTGVVDGESFFKQFCTPDDSGAASNSSASTPTPSTTPIIPTTEVPFQPLPTGYNQTHYDAPSSWYPEAVISSDDLLVSGYFPEDNVDLAVLAITSFQVETPGPAFTQFSNTVRLFLATAQAAGKTKLMIDLRGNGGGVVPLAYDLFGQLFPNLYPYGATNFRATPLLDDIGYIISEHYSNTTNLTATPADCDSTFSLHPFNYREQLDQNNEVFTSWADYYGPETREKDNFTSISRYSLADTYSIFCKPISNYGNLTNITPQVFQPENIVLVQDGGCASTCAVFTEFMKSQAKVKQIVFGGRKQTGPMQGVGGVKGANVYPFSVIADAAGEAYEDAGPIDQVAFEAAYGNLTEPVSQAMLRAAVGADGSQLASVNVRNNIRYGDETVTPLQFVYEAADCRLFYTIESIFAQSEVWKAAYASTWGGGSCVADSTGHPSSAPASDAIYSAPEQARNFFGAKRISSWPEDLVNKVDR